MGNPHRYPSKIQIPTAAERRLRRHLLIHNHTVHVDMLVVRWRAKCMHGLPPVLIPHIAAEIMHRLRFPSDMTGHAESTATREGSVVVVPRKDAKLARLRRLQIIRASAETAAAANDERLLHNRSRRRSASDEDDAATETAASHSSSHGAVSMIGRRREMEDAVTTAPGFASSVAHGCIPALETYDLFGVYDGHCGASVAFACRDRLHVVLAEEVAALGGWPKAEDQWRAVMEASFSRMDRELAAAPGETEVGSTAVVGADCIVVANCSDSRALLRRGGIAVPLSSDHKPDRPDEMKRVEAAGGRIVNWDVHRVSGMLAVSRSLGTWDHYLKQYVISVTEVTVTERSTKDELLIVASDGLWDLVSNETSCRIASRCLNRQPATKASEKKGRREPRAAQAAALLAELAYSRGSRDNQRGGGSAVNTQWPYEQHFLTIKQN